MAKKGNKAGKLIVWLLLAMLIVGLAGFGIGSFGGNATAVGSVGGRDITAQAYFRALNQALRAQQAQSGRALTLPEAEAQGIPAQIRGQLAGAAAVDNEADRMGLSVGDARVAEQLREQQGFSGPTGQFDRTAYEFALRQNGWTVKEFEANVRAETARAIIQGAVGGGVTAPEAWVDTVMGFYAERRSFRWVRFDESSLAEPLPTPDAASVQAFYDANPALFTLPERKRITYAWIRPEDALDEVEVDEDKLKELYQDRIVDYVQPERRLVERLVFQDEAAAEAALAAIESGETAFVTLVEERGLTLDDVDLGEARLEDLDEAGPAVFALTEPGVVGPFPTSLGPALFRMNGILSASEIPYEEARPELLDDYSRDAARRTIANRIGDYEDALAAGATLEDLANETGMTLGSIDYDPEVSEGIAGYSGFRTAAETLTADDFPRIDLLDDGSAFAMRLDEVVPPALQPLDEMRDLAVEGAKAEALRTALTELATTAQTTLEATRSLDSTGTVETATLVTRDTPVESAPPELVARAFTLEAGGNAIVSGPLAAYLVQLDAVEGPDTEDERITALRNALEARTSQSVSADIIQLYARALTSSAGIRFDDAALNAIHSQIFR